MTLRDARSKPKPTICQTLGSHAVTEGRCPSCKWVLVPDAVPYNARVNQTGAGVGMAHFTPILSIGTSSPSGGAACPKGHVGKWGFNVKSGGRYCRPCRGHAKAAA